MNLFQLECFLAVAGNLNFARAAEQMNITQPSITHQIQTLENELTVKLFHRSTRSVELTIEGRIFLTDAQNIVSMSRNAIGRFEQKDSLEILDLSIGYYQLAGFPIPPEVLRDLSHKYPGLHPHFHTLPDSQLLARVEDGSLDIAIKLKDHGKGKNTLTYKELGRLSFACVMREDHPLAAKERISFQSLRHEKLILYDPGFAGPEMIKFQWKLLEGKKPSELHFCESQEAALLLTISGFGVSIVPVTYHLPENQQIKGIPIDGADTLPFGIYYKSCQGKPYLKDLILGLQSAVMETHRKK